MSISVILLRGLVGEFRAHGLPVEPLLEAAGVAESVLGDLSARLSGPRWKAAERLARSALGDAGLGLTLAANTSQHGLPIFGHLLLAASDLREAVALAQRYSALVFDDLCLQLDEQRGLATLCCSTTTSLSDWDAQFFAEYWTVTALRIARQVASSAVPKRVAFRHAAPAYRELYEQLFACPVAFLQPRDEVVFDAAALSRPNLHGDATMRAVLREAADRLLTGLPEGERLVERVRSVLCAQHDLPVIDLDAVARRVGLSRRALARRLRLLGHTVTSLLLEERREMACRELSSPDCCIKATAERLGYSEPSAFHRAFKRWTGKTPAQYARSNRRAPHVHTLHALGA